MCKAHIKTQQHVYVTYKTQNATKTLCAAKRRSDSREVETTQSVPRPEKRLDIAELGADFLAGGKAFVLPQHPNTP